MPLKLVPAARPGPLSNLAAAIELVARFEKAREAKARDEDPAWSVRERLGARAGRLHVMRSVKRTAKQLKVEDVLGLPSSGQDFVLPKSNRKRKRPSRRGDRSESGGERRARKKK